MQTLTWHFNTGGEQIKEQSTDKNALQNCIMTEKQPLKPDTGQEAGTRRGRTEGG